MKRKTVRSFLLYQLPSQRSPVPALKHSIAARRSLGGFRIKRNILWRCDLRQSMQNIGHCINSKCSMTTVFLSHKSQDASAAEALKDSLSVMFGIDKIFLAEEIDKGDDWRKAIDQALVEAKCFLLLYTDPQLDWSWCFYEAGAFAKMGSKPERPVFCLHPFGVPPPSPLANLQTLRAIPEEPGQRTCPD